MNGGHLNLTNTVIDGSGTNSFGSAGMLVTSNADVSATGNSRIVGDQNGVVFKARVAGVIPDFSDNTFALVSSEVIGRAGSAVYVDGQGSSLGGTSFTMNNASSVQGGNGVAFEVINNGALDISSDASTINGSLVAESGSALHASIQNGSTLVGAMQNVGIVNLADSRWLVGGDSTLATLDARNSVIEFDAAGTFKTVNIAGNLDTAGVTFVFNTVLADDTSASDRLIVGGDTSGQAFIRVKNVGGAGAQTVAGIEIITVGGASNGQFDLAGRAVGGQYEYFLFKDSGNWYLRSQLPPPPDPCIVDPTLPACPGNPDPGNPDPGDPDPGNPDPGNPDPGGPEPVLRPEAGAYLANVQAAQNMFRIGYHDRAAGQNSGRGWARVDGSRNGFDAVNRELHVHGNSQSLSVGVDAWRSESGSAAGVMLSSGNASSTSNNSLTGYYARGKVKGASVGVYGTWRSMQEDPYSGLYVDGSLQRAQFRNRVEGVGLASERYDSRAWQAAVETGYAFRVGGPNSGGLYLEPQVQVGYNSWDNLRHTEANGTVVTTQDVDGLFGRAGVRMSGVTRWGNGTAEVQPYLAAHWLHTSAESRISMNDEVLDTRVPRSRAEVSAGASLKFANGWQAWGSLARQQASGYHQTSAQLGMSYSW